MSFEIVFSGSEDSDGDEFSTPKRMNRDHLDVSISSTGSEMNSLYISQQDKEETLQTIMKSNKKYKEKEKNIQESILELKQKAKITFTFLNKKKEELVSRNRLLKDQIESFPSLEVLQGQLNILKKAIETYKPDSALEIELQPLYSNGILQSWEDARVLPQKIDKFYKELQKMNETTKYNSQFIPHSSKMFAPTQEEEVLRLRIKMLESQIQKSKDQFLESRNSIERDIVELENQINNIYKKSYIPVSNK